MPEIIARSDKILLCKLMVYLTDIIMDSMIFEGYRRELVMRFGRQGEARETPRPWGVAPIDIGIYPP